MFIQESEKHKFAAYYHTKFVRDHRTGEAVAEISKKIDYHLADPVINIVVKN